MNIRLMETTGPQSDHKTVLILESWFSHPPQTILENTAFPNLRLMPVSS